MHRGATVVLVLSRAEGFWITVTIYNYLATGSPLLRIRQTILTNAPL